MNLQQLRYAQALAECGSFGVAAARCCVTQPTLSNGIAQLERDLGHALFARTTRSVQITAAGHALLPALGEVLRAQAALVALAQRLTHPEHPLLRIGVSPLIGIALLDLLVDPFRRTHPDVQIIFRELNLAEMIRQAEAGQLDYVFGPLDADAPLGPGWDMVSLGQEGLIYIPQGGRARTDAAVTLAEIAAETFVLVPDACGLTRATRALFRRHRLGLREYAGEAMSYRVLQEWADLGIGAAILPRSKVGGRSGVPIHLRKGATSPVTIAYHALWRSADATRGPDDADFRLYLQEVAPHLLRGLG